MEMMTGCFVTGKSCTVIQFIPVSKSRNLNENYNWPWWKLFVFSFRGVLLNFKREFSMEDVFTLWEVSWSVCVKYQASVVKLGSCVSMWSLFFGRLCLQIIWCDHLTKHFQLFVAVAILVHYKQELLLCKTVESLMQVSNLGYLLEKCLLG